MVGLKVSFSCFFTPTFAKAGKTRRGKKNETDDRNMLKGAASEKGSATQKCVSSPKLGQGAWLSGCRGRGAGFEPEREGEL